MKTFLKSPISSSSLTLSSVWGNDEQDARGFDLRIWEKEIPNDTAGIKK